MKIKRPLCFIFSFLTIISVVGCKSKGNEKIEIPEYEEEPIEYTQYKLVDNGKSDYKIVLENNASYDEEIAALEIEELFEEATSVKLSTVSESEVSYNENSKLIILGNTQYTQNAQIDVGAIPKDGYTVKTVDSNLFILGEDCGVVYGVYEFLKKTVGFEYYVADVYALNKDVKNLYMPKLDNSDSPDIEYRADAWGAETSEQGKYRARVKDVGDAFMHDGMHYVHNTFRWLPKESFEEEHSCWYSDDGQQLCYNAHGDPNELALMQEEVLKQMQYQIDYYFSLGDFSPAISFTQEDSSSGSWCGCEKCKSDNDTYGAKASSLIRFLNPIARELKSWLNEKWSGHEVTIVFFAYQETEGAPVKEENNEYVPIDESVVLEDNLAVWIAPIRGDYIRSVKDVNNESIISMFKKWSVLTQSFYVWTYDTNFKNYLMWYDTFNALPDLYKFVHNYGAKYVFNQGQIYSGSNFTSFDAYKIALNYKLMWDTDVNVKHFTDNFFKTWFGSAANDMREYYESFRSWSEYLKSEKGLNGHIYIDGYTKDEYPKQVLYGWLENIENAYESLESLNQTSPKEYAKYYNRVKAESMSIRYALIQIHGENDMKEEFKTDAIKLGFTKKGGASPIEGLWKIWDI